MSPIYYDKAEEIVDLLVRKTQTEDRHFFRVLVAYYMAKLASMMRTDIEIPDRGTIPVSLYALNLGSSGLGKTYSMNILEEELIGGFKQIFLNEIFPKAAEINLSKLACTRSAKYEISPEDALIILQAEFESSGTLAFSFDSGTVPAIKQMRHMLLMANAGSLNYECDEIGSELIGNTEVLNAFLQLFDIGKIKIKLIKNTKENIRSEEIDGRTPTNMMLFGTPDSLFDGSKTEDTFIKMEEAGYARRLLCGYSQDIIKQSPLTAEEQYARGISNNTDELVNTIKDYITGLADISRFNTKLTMAKSVAIRLIQYRIDCEALALTLRDHDAVAKAELSHRYYKAVKLAGAYAFMDKSKSITITHLNAAIALVEDSGEAFQRIMNRDRNYVRLAKYLADMNQEVTSVDLLEDLPWYPKTEMARRDVMNLAIAYGYKNNIIIKTSMESGIEFFIGESLTKTDLKDIKISYGIHLAQGFEADKGPFNHLHKVVTAEGHHYTSHAFKGNHRHSDNVIPGFNLLILDVDDKVSLETAKFLLQDHEYLMATTKRHTDAKNRFRILMPLSHIVKLTTEEHVIFMENVFKWLPFLCDTSTKDIARKWCSHPGEYWYNKGELVDATLFIPKTSKSEEHNEFINNNTSLSNLERWFISNTSEGNRSNNLIRFGYVLIDAKFSFDEIKERVRALNKKLKKSLPANELTNTVIASLGKKLESK